MFKKKITITLVLLLVCIAQCKLGRNERIDLHSQGLKQEIDRTVDRMITQANGIIRQTKHRPHLTKGEKDKIEDLLYSISRNLKSNLVSQNTKNLMNTCIGHIKDVLSNQIILQKSDQNLKNKNNLLLTLTQRSRQSAGAAQDINKIKLDNQRHRHNHNHNNNQNQVRNSNRISHVSNVHSLNDNNHGNLNAHVYQPMQLNA